MSQALVDRPPRLGAPLSVSNLTKNYDGTAAVRDVSFELAEGELLSILGPSGSGKSTTMMAIAGFVTGYSGEIRMRGQRMDHLPPHLRGVGVVFQHLELFPHMTVADNIAFPLRMRGMGASTIAKQVPAILDLVRLPGFERRLPAQLSGGQQQRVALARAIVFSPPLLLLDEPFGALDRKLREEMQLELKALHQRLGISIIHVTHDQAEAMAISDRVAIMHDGRLEQVGTPREIYFSPQSKFIAGFVGESIFLPGTVTRGSGTECEVEGAGGIRTFGRALNPLPPGTRVTIMLRPEAVRILGNGVTARNSFIGRVVDQTFIGDRTKYDLALEGGQRIGLTVHNRTSRPDIPPGSDITVGWDAGDALLMTD